MPRSTLARRARALTIIGAVGAMAAGLFAQPVLAAPGDTVLTVAAAQLSGTASFDALDPDGANNLIRTNDDARYTVSVRNEPAVGVVGGGEATNLRIVFTLPRGQQTAVADLDPLCLPGSTVTPTLIDTSPDLDAPLTSTDWNSLSLQTVTCLLAPRPSGSTTLDYQFSAQVRAEVPNGTVLSPLTVTAQATEDADGAASTLPPLTVVSAPKYELSKNGTSNANDNTGRVVSASEVCVSPANLANGYSACQTLMFPILVSVQAGGKGSTPLSSAMTFTEELSPDAFFGPGTTSKPGWNASLAASIVGCGRVANLEQGGSFYPYGSGGSATVANSVADSGAFSCNMGGTGAQTITITGTDTTATNYPATNGTFNVAMPADKAYIVSGWVKIEFPAAALTAIGVPVSAGSTEYKLPYYNAFTNFAGTALDGSPMPAETNLNNNVRQGTSATGFGIGFAKGFVGEPGNPTNSGGSGYAAGNVAGPVGSTSSNDGQGIVQAGSRVNGFLTSTAISPPGYGSVRAVICDAWDNTKLALTADQWRAIQAGTTSAAAPLLGYCCR